MKVTRRTLVIIAATITLGIAVIVGSGALWLLKSNAGRTFVTTQLVSLVKSRVHGRVYIGQVSGILDHPRVDSIEIRDMDDSVMFASGSVQFDYDLLDIWDKRLVFRNVVIERPYIHLRHGKDGVWNFKKVMASGSGGIIDTIQRRIGAHKLGDLMLLERVKLIDGHLKWTEPWGPSSYLRGAARDSAIKYNLARTDAEVRRVGRDLWRTRHWHKLELDASHVRLKDPDVRGFAIKFGLLNANETDPPFIIRNASGNVLFADDTVTFAINEFQLPGSRGTASGKLFTKRGLGVRVRVIGDTVSLADIAWIYPTLPREGGGRMTLDIRKDSTSDFIDYQLTKMDVISTQSHLRGAMAFGGGHEILEVRDVDLDLAPVDFKLIETFNGGPLTLPWRGQLTGHVLARGGPLTHFFVDSAAIDFADANVPGVVNRMRGAGELDILRPILTSFHDFAVDVQHFDLRTPQALDSLFPPWKGFVRGTARLDSIWTDVRLREANFYYIASDTSPTSHFTGGGRVTTGEVEMSYDLALNADPFHLQTMKLAYPAFPLKGAFSGPFTLKGPMRDLVVSGDVHGEGARIRTDSLWMNALGPVFALRGAMDLQHVDPSKILDSAAAMQGDLSAVIDADVSGDSLSKLTGGVKFTLAPRSTFKDIRMHGGYARLTFGEGLMRVDSLSLSSDALTLRGSGALGLRADRRDTLRIVAAMDSLGGVRALIEAANDTLPATVMSGAITGTAVLAGSIDSLDVQLGLHSTDFAYGTLTAKRLNIDGAIADLTRTRKGLLALTGENVGLSGVTFSAADARAVLAGNNTARVTGKLTGTEGSVIDAGANVAWDSTQVQTKVDSLQIAMGDHQWRLARTATFVTTRDAFRMDSLELRSGTDARLFVNAALPLAGPVAGTLRAEAFPLGDFSKLFHIPIPVSGAAGLDISLAGTREAPIIKFDVQARNATLGDTRVEGLHATGDYNNRSLATVIEYRRKDVVVMRAEAALPLDLALKPVTTRKLGTALKGTLVADSTDLAVLESFTSAIRKTTGVFDARLDLAGTWAAPQLNGHVRVAHGSMELPTLGGIRYDDVHAQLHFLGDSLQIDTLLIHNDRAPGYAKLYGYVAMKDVRDPRFKLVFTSDQFHAIANKDLADLVLTTDPVQGLRLEGSKSRSTLAGGMGVNGDIYVPDTYTKSIIALDERDYTGGVDTAAFAGRRLVPNAFASFIDNMRVENVAVRAGNDLWLQSSEAKIQLGGELTVKVVPSTRANDRARRQLALTGALIANKGSYRLNLGLVQRTFVVENGSITWYGDPDNIPLLNINALYTVRQYDQRDARQDVRVRATVGGTLAAPTVSLSSPDSIRTSTADLYSYLLTGAPSLEIGGRNSPVSTTLTRTLITSAGSVFGSKIGGALNLDELELSTAGLEAGYGGGARKATSNVFRGARLGGGKQVKDWLFLRIDTGLCQVGQLFDTSSFDVAGFANTVGMKADFRMTNSLSLSVGFEPPTSALLCAQSATARGFVPTPRQYGLDVVRVWRF